MLVEQCSDLSSNLSFEKVGAVGFDDRKEEMGESMGPLAGSCRGGAWTEKDGGRPVGRIAAPCRCSVICFPPSSSSHPSPTVYSTALIARPINERESKWSHLDSTATKRRRTHGPKMHVKHHEGPRATRHNQSKTTTKSRY